MNFIQAIRLAREGKEVRRKGWHNKHCTLSEETFRDSERTIGMNNHSSQIRIPYMINGDDVLADDWEIYE